MSSAFRKSRLRRWVKLHIYDRILFDEVIYLQQNMDALRSPIPPREHYYSVGCKEGYRCHAGLLSIKDLLWYWLGGMLPKQKNNWVFTSFRNKGYLDNAKYLFEYVVKHHPEIQATWITEDEAVYHQLKERGLNVKTPKEARKTMLRAQLAITDHYRLTDYKTENGFNARTKLVQLWHGVGLKSMHPIGDVIPSTGQMGVRLSSDLFPMKGDGLLKRLYKKINYFFRAPARELYEKYYAFVCPGEERIKNCIQVWRVPESAVLYAGHPRNVMLHSSPVPSKPKLLYAPTFRWRGEAEEEMVASMLRALPTIHARLDAVEGELRIRLHPHTFRDYEELIEQALQSYPRISLDKEKDIYTTLGQYSIIISDYSSIAYDFVLLDRPVIFLVPDKESFVSSEVVFNYPFDEYSPGPQVQTWEEVMNEAMQYITNPAKDSAWRCRVRDELYSMEHNDACNSARIVAALKERLRL